MANEDRPTAELMRMTVQIVTAHLSNNTVATADLAPLIDSVHRTLTSTAAGELHGRQPAVPIKKSVAPDHITCLEDGLKLKVLKRHLKTAHDLTPEAYRKRWNLPRDYPVVAPAYARQRSALAKSLGLGIKQRHKGKK